MTVTGGTVSDSIYNDDFGNFGAAKVKTFVADEFGSVTQTAATLSSSGDCGTAPVTCSSSTTGTGKNKKTVNSATYSGTAADIFAIHWGGGGDDQPLLAIEFSSPVTSFTISGFDHGVSFIRAFDSVTSTPLPAALPLFATGLGVMGWFGARRKRKSAAALAAA